MSVVSAFCTMCNRSVYVDGSHELSCPVCSSPLVPTDVDQENATRIADNETMFRDVNERIKNIQSGSAAEGLNYHFVCECGNPDCSEQINLSVAEYNEVRSHPVRFITKPRHNIPGAEIIIAEHPEWIVVEKQGAAAQIAREKDPRLN